MAKEKSIPSSAAASQKGGLSAPGSLQAGLFRGVAVDLSRDLHVTFWVLLALVTASLCFSQFGIMSYGDEMEGAVNFVFLLVPVALGAIMLGFVPGVTLGIEAGILLMLRSSWTPTSYFDMFLSDPTLSVASVTAGSLLMSTVITLAARKWPADLSENRNPLLRIRPGKAVAIVLGSLLLASCFSYGARGAGYLLYETSNLEVVRFAQDLLSQISETTTVIEVLLNTAILSVIGIACELMDANRRCGVWENSLRSVFQRWLLLTVAMVFLAASTTSFCIETFRANANTQAELNKQLDYLQLQVEDHEARLADLKKREDEMYQEKGLATAELVAADKTLLSDQQQLSDLAKMLGLESLTITDGKGRVIADSEYGDRAIGYSFDSQESTKPYMALIEGGDPIVEGPRASVDPDGTVGSKTRVFCGVPRVDEPGIVQISGSAASYEKALSAASIEHLADDYTAEHNGIVAVVRNYEVVTTNSSLLRGKSVLDVFVETEEDFDDIVNTDELVTGYYEQTKSMVVVKSRIVGDYVLLALVSLPETFATRTSTLLYNGAFFLILFAVIFFMATRLLRNVVVEPIRHTNDTLEHITAGDLNKRVDERRVTEFESLSRGINTTVAALKDSIAEAEQRNAQELLTAKAIQESSLPRDFPPFPDIDKFDIYASMKTAKEVGGDFYDFFLVEPNKLGFVIADVSGKGIPAALFMMTAKTQVQNYMDAGLSVAEAVDAANHQLCLGNDAGMFVTLFACELDYETGELEYVNAGHNPPLLLHDGTWEWMRDVSGMPLGLFDGMPYDQFSRKLCAGDMLYLYTDGVTEAMNDAEELFGEKRLEQTLYHYADMNPRSVGVGVRRALTDFTLDCEQSDDITMLVLKYGVPPEKEAVMILPAVDTQLVHVYNFIHEELNRRGAPKSVYNPLDIAAEELFVNVCHYAYPDATPENPGQVRISFQYDGNPPALTVQIIDDGIPYNPLEKPDAVTPDDVMEVPIGGLGILMAKNSVDEMTYERDGESNMLTFKKCW